MDRTLEIGLWTPKILKTQKILERQKLKASLELIQACRVCMCVYVSVSVCVCVMCVGRVETKSLSLDLYPKASASHPGEEERSTGPILACTILGDEQAGSPHSWLQHPHSS